MGLEAGAEEQLLGYAVDADHSGFFANLDYFHAGELAADTEFAFFASFKGLVVENGQTSVGGPPRDALQRDVVKAGDGLGHCRLDEFAPAA